MKPVEPPVHGQLRLAKAKVDDLLRLIGQMPVGTAARARAGHQLAQVYGDLVTAAMANGTGTEKTAQ